MKTYERRVLVKNNKKAIDAEWEPVEARYVANSIEQYYGISITGLTTALSAMDRGEIVRTKNFEYRVRS